MTGAEWEGEIGSNVWNAGWSKSSRSDILLTQMAVAQNGLLRLPAVRTDCPDSGPSAWRLGLSQNVAGSWSLHCNSDGTMLCTTLESDNSHTNHYHQSTAEMGFVSIVWMLGWILAELSGVGRCRANANAFLLHRKGQYHCVSAHCMCNQM